MLETGLRGKVRATSVTSLALSACLALAGLAAACGDDSVVGGSGNGGSEPVGGNNAGSPPNGGAPTNGGGGADGGAVADGGGGGVSDGGGGAGCGVLPPLETAPDLLSETGLYSDFATETVAPYILPYAPRYPLWSDNATKERWAYIPDPSCDGPIDTSDMDFWQVPVGSRFWKEFTRDGERIETRLITRFGPDASDFEFATYHWDGSGDAVKISNGLDNANGTGHDIPPITLCASCHKSDWRILGFSAIQLTHGNGGATMSSLSADGFLSNPLPEGVTIPGSQVEQDALGYLHSNCGNCHFNGGVGNVPMHLKVLSTETTVDFTEAFLTAVNQGTSNYQCAGSPCDYIEPLSPSTSAVWLRMSESTMPPFASEVPDNTGAATVAAWINSLPLDANN